MQKVKKRKEARVSDLSYVQEFWCFFCAFRKKSANFFSLKNQLCALESAFYRFFCAK